MSSETTPARITRRGGLKLTASAVIATLASGIGLPALAQQTPPVAVDTPWFDLLPDWSHAGMDAPMSVADLIRLKDAAFRFLTRNESGDLAGLEKELQDFAARYCQPGAGFDAKKASGLFLLLRIVFDLPDLTGADQVWNFGGWYSAEDSVALKGKRKEDDFHPSWPIYLARISNKLYVSSNTNAASIGDKPDYRALEEYRFLRSKFRFRKAAEIGKMEFIFVAGK